MLPKFQDGARKGGGGIGSAWSRYLPYVDTFKKRACRFILHHYLGRFLKDHLTLDQLTIDLYNGTGSLHKVPIDIYNVNDVLESQGIPIEVVGGEIETITVSIPWANIFQSPSMVEINSMTIAVKGQSASSDSTFLTDSYFNSLMSTSIRVAQQCFKENEDLPTAGSDQSREASPKSQGEALEFFAQAIETVLLKVKISLVDTKIRFEPCNPWSDSIEVMIKRIDFFDDSLGPDSDASGGGSGATEEETQDDVPQFFASNFCTKVFKIEGMTLSHVPNSCNVNKLFTEVLSTSQLHEAAGKKSNPVKIGEFLGKMEAKIKMKQNANVSGPRITVDCVLGSLSLFTEPKHIKVLIDVLDGFINSSAPTAVHAPGVGGGTESRQSGSRCGRDGSDMGENMFATCHPAASSTFPVDMLERHLGTSSSFGSNETLTHRQQAMGTAGLGGGGGVGGGAASVVYTDEDFYSIYEDQSEHNSMTSSMISATTTTTTNTNQPFDNTTGREKSKTDMSEDPVLVNIRFNGVSLVLLEASTENFESLATHFFGRFHEVTNLNSGFGPKDVFQQKKLIQSACEMNHLALLACPVNARLIINQSNRSSKSNALLTFAFFEMTECLNTSSGRQDSVIVTFVNQKDFYVNAIVTQPNMKIDISWADRHNATSGPGGKRLSVLLELAPAIVNLDLTLLDRLIEFFDVPTGADKFGQNELNASLVVDPEKDLLVEKPEEVHCFELNCTELSLTFYIPIPVFEEDKKNLVTTQRLIRSEAFLAVFSSLAVKLDYSKWEEDLSVCVEMDSADLFVVSNLISLKLCRIASEQRSKPFVSFKLYPFRYELAAQNLFDMNTASMYDSFPCDFSGKSSRANGPFSSKVIIHNSQPVVKCGTFEELKRFSDECLGDSRLVLKVSLPDVCVFFPSKAVFDLVYNRFANDLLLWEPLFSQRDAAGLEHSGHHRVGLGLASQEAAMRRTKQHFSMCKSGIRSIYATGLEGFWGGGSTGVEDEETEEEQDEDDDDDDCGASQNWLSFQLKFGTVKLAISDVTSEEERVAFQSFSDLKNGNLFVVAGHGSSSDTTYFTFSCYDAQYYHSYDEATCKPFSFDSHFNVHFPSYMDMKLRKSRLDIMEKPQSFSNPVLSTVVKIQANRHRDFKHIKVAVNAEGLTLLQGFDQTKWVQDLACMLSPKDQPIPGYNFSPVVTELHLSLTNCAVLYRPLRLPYTLLLNTGCVYVSSNLAADSPSSIFQVVIESASLYLSCTRSLKSRLADFAKIVDTGLIGLDVVTQKSREERKEKGRDSKVVVRLSCDILNVYTCSDSLSVISEIVQYLAANGDCPKSAITPEDPLKFPADSSGPDGRCRRQRRVSEGLTSTKEVKKEAETVDSTRRREESENLNAMIQEAISEDLTASFHPDYSSETTQNVFLFPDDQVTKITDAQSEVGNEEDKGVEEEEDSRELTKSAARAVVTLSPSDSFEGGMEGVMVASQFCVIESPFVRKNSYEGECAILFLDEDELHLVEHHFEKPMPGKRDMLKPASYLPQPAYSYNIQEFNVCWKLYAGYDFPTSIGMQYGRDKSNSVEVCLRKIELLYDQYAIAHSSQQSRSSLYKSRLALACDDIEILDRISSSAINKMLYCYSSENCLRQAHAHMVLFKCLECSPSEPNQLGSEYVVRLNLLPIRLNFDQCTVFFLSDFFSSKSSSADSSGSESLTRKSSLGASGARVGGDVERKQAKPSRVSFKASENELRVDLPRTSSPSKQRSNVDVLDNSEDATARKGSAGVQKGILLSTTCKSSAGSPLKSTYNASNKSTATSTSFIKEFTFLSDVMIKFDYHGKYFDMDRGKLIGLLVGLAQVQCSHLVLKRLEINQGILGFDNLVLHCLTEWMNDIKKNQIGNLLGGIGPMYSFTQIFHGLVDLVCMPVEQYRRDGRILKGFQRGAASFTTSSTSAALQLTNRLLSTIQFTAEMTFDLLSPSPRPLLPAPHSRHSAQPNDFRQGLNMAYRTLYEGLNDTAAVIVREAVELHGTRGLTGAVGGVLRQIPPTLIAPVILASEATCTVIDGVSHQLAPDCRNEALSKWKY